jgi:hypothetical protein
MKRVRWQVAVIALAACSSSGSAGSGVDGNKKLVDLSAADKDALCAYAVQAEGAPRTVTCTGGVTLTLKDQAGCVAGFAQIGASCTATVGQAEGCFHAIGADPCSFGGSACAPLLQCAIGMVQ